MASTPEGKVKDRVKKLLAEYPGIWTDWPVPGGYGKSTLDCFGCYKGRFFIIETKAEGKVPTPLQAKCIRDVIAAGGAAFVITGGDNYGFEKLRAWLNKHLLPMEY